jgi:hypothetical protein
MDGTEPLLKPPETTRACRASLAAPGEALTRVDCLNLLLRAFCDLADRDDIHQADQRLQSVRRWIRREAKRAATDAIFAELPSAGQRGAAVVRQRRPAIQFHSDRDQWPIP